jgi:hypothetical protein
MSGFLQSTSGRLITLSLSLALLGGGAGAVLGGVTGVTLLMLGILLGIVASIMGVAFGIERHGGYVALFVLMSPWALFLYTIGTFVAFNYQPSAGYLLIALGLASIARAVFVSEKLDAREETSSREVHAH